MAAKWPTSAATDADLSVAVNSLQTTLSAGIDNVVVSIPLTSTTGFPAAGYVTIDNEVISYTGVSGGNLTGAVRGADGTSAAAHLAAAPVSATIVAAHHNSLKDEMKAVEGDLFNAISAITPSAAGATATTLYNRFQHLTNQIKVGFGLTNWYDTITNAIGSYLLKAGGTMAGALAMGSNKITGLAAASANGDAVRYEQLPNITAPASYTPTVAGHGTIANVNIYWARLGNLIHIYGTYQAGTVSGTTYSFTTPAGQTIDFTKGANLSMVGLFPEGATGTPKHIAFLDGSTAGTVFSSFGNSSPFGKEPGNNYGNSTYIGVDLWIPVT